MKRFWTWEELSDARRADALEKLRRLALRQARENGVLLPPGWPERVAPLLRYSLFDGGLWDCHIAASHRAQGIRDIFEVPLSEEVPA